jgi:DNA-binding transcriptional LysR family regulator
MERRALQLLRTLGEAGHFGRAAERLGTTQPHLSFALRRLENALGLQLLQRRPTVRLTAGGEIIVQAAQRAFADIDQAVETARLVQAGASGVVTVGFASTVMLTDLAPRIRDFRRTTPGVRLSLVEMHSNPQWSALTAGRLDVALTREIKRDPEVACELILREPLVVALPSDHSLAPRGPTIALEDLADEPFVLFPEEAAPGMYAAILSACTAAGFVPRIVQQADEWQTMLAFVAFGDCVTIGPTCIRALGFDRVVFRALHGGAGPVGTFLCHRRAAVTPATAAFLEFIRCERAAVPQGIAP